MRLPEVASDDVELAYSATLTSHPSRVEGGGMITLSHSKAQFDILGDTFADAITLFRVSLMLPVCLQSTVTFMVRMAESYRSFWRKNLTSS